MTSQWKSLEIWAHIQMKSFLSDGTNVDLTHVGIRCRNNEPTRLLEGNLEWIMDTMQLSDWEFSFKAQITFFSVRQ